MTFGSSSAVFAAQCVSAFGTRGTGDSGFTGSTIKAALFNNTTTPDKTAAVGLTGYGAATSAWVTGNAVSDTSGNGNWAAAGVTLGSKTLAAASNVVTGDAADAAGAGTLTIANAYGALVYNDSVTAGTVVDQGICFNSFGGAQSVTGGTFTIVWSASGIFQITV